LGFLEKRVLGWTHGPRKLFLKIGFYTIVRLIKARRTIEEFSSGEISLTMVISGRLQGFVGKLSL
jgi:hypothetical protein